MGRIAIPGKCKRCEGSGRTYWLEMGVRRYHTCDACGGTGKAVEYIDISGQPKTEKKRYPKLGLPGVVLLAVAAVPLGLALANKATASPLYAVAFALGVTGFLLVALSQGWG
jgi:hypothetical protein